MPEIAVLTLIYLKLGTVPVGCNRGRGAGVFTGIKGQLIGTRQCVRLFFGHSYYTSTYTILYV